MSELNSVVHEDFGPNFRVLKRNDQTCELQTIIRDRLYSSNFNCAIWYVRADRPVEKVFSSRNTNRNDFKFYADRLIRLVIEESLNQLPYTPCTVVTPIGFPYDGLQFEKGNCGVSIVRSGEAMEQGLRDCCRSMRIGKILIDSDHDTHEAKVVYAKFPEDIAQRKVLLMYPIMSTGNTVVKAVSVLKDHSVLEENIVLANLFCTPPATQTIVTAFPQMKILTSEIHPVAPNHFGQKYFGTD